MLYHLGDNQHTKNIRINKVIGENEKCVFYFMEKTKQTCWPTQYLHMWVSKLYCFPSHVQKVLPPQCCLTALIFSLGNSLVEAGAGEILKEHCVIKG